MLQSKEEATTVSQDREKPRRLVLKGSGTEQTNRGQQESSRQSTDRPAERRGAPQWGPAATWGERWSGQGRREADAEAENHQSAAGRRSGSSQQTLPGTVRRWQRRAVCGRPVRKWWRRRLGIRRLTPKERGRPAPHTGAAGHSTETPAHRPQDGRRGHHCLAACGRRS